MAGCEQKGMGRSCVLALDLECFLFFSLANFSLMGDIIRRKYGGKHIPKSACGTIPDIVYDSISPGCSTTSTSKLIHQWNDNDVSTKGTRLRRTNPPRSTLMGPADPANLRRTSMDSRHAVPPGRTGAVWRRQQSRHVIATTAWAISAACHQPSQPRPVGHLWGLRVGFEVLYSWKITFDQDIRLGQLSEGLVPGRLPEATSNRHQRATPTV